MEGSDIILRILDSSPENNGDSVLKYVWGGVNVYVRNIPCCNVKIRKVFS